MSAFIHWLYAFLFSPKGGEWGYPYLGLPGLDVALLLALLVPASLVVIRISEQRIERHEWQTLAALIGFAFVAQLSLRALGATTLAEVVEHPGANGFLGVARTYTAAQYLSQFDSLREQLPMHARANLPGKVLFFQLLLAITTSPAVMGLLIVLISTCGGALVYFLAREWFGDRRAALYAFAFYVFIPARIFFLPGMNTVTPLFLLLPMCLLEVHFKTGRYWPLVLAGVGVYALVIFEPLPLAAGPIVLGQIWWHSHRQSAPWIVAGRALVVPAIAAGATYLGMRLLFGFDLFSAFLTALEDARRFNQSTLRPYSVWVFHNVKEFFLEAGAGQSLLFFAALSMPVSGRTWLAIPIAAVVLTLTVLGLNRGETARLWIFLGVLMQIAAAQACASRPRLFRIVLAVAIVQAAVLTSSVGWITVR